MDKEKAIISDGLSSVAPLFNERCSYNGLIALNTSFYQEEAVESAAGAVAASTGWRFRCKYP